MAEEQRRWQEGHRLCSNNCGFFGSPATNDLCSNCYRDLRLKDHNNNNNALSSSSSSSSSSSVAGVVIPSHPQQQPSSEAVAPPPPAASLVVEVVRANRCGECRKKVGLTGFRCRCGSTYCGAHRHPESHACRFDFKSAGKEAIARANPLVRADKLTHKI